MAAATARIVVLTSPDEKDRIATQARLEGVSMGDFMHRCAASQMSDAEPEAELQERRPELQALLDELEASNARPCGAGRGMGRGREDEAPLRADASRSCRFLSGCSSASSA